MFGDRKTKSHCGNCYTENVEGINVHKYGRIFFIRMIKEIWDYVNALVEFNRYTNSLVAMNNGNCTTCRLI